MIWQAPGFLWLLLAVPIVVWLVPRRISDVRHALLRALVFAAVLVGLARPVTLADATTEHVVFVRDVSRSVGGLTEGAWDAAVDRARARGGRDTLRLTRVDVGPHQWLPAEGAPVLDPDPRFDRLLQVENAMSPLAQGLEIAARQVPLGARGTVILCTDGAGTDASHAVAAQALTARGIPVVAVVDTNCSPDGVDYIIPGNDDAARAISLYCDLVSRSALDGMSAQMGAAGVDIGAMEEAPVEEAAAE